MNRPRYQFDRMSSGHLPPNRANESSKYSIVVKHIPATVSRQSIIDFAKSFGDLAVEPHITQPTERLQKMAFLTFTDNEAVERCMTGPRETFVFDGYRVSVQRWLPLGCTFERSYRLLVFLEMKDPRQKLTEEQIRAYFEENFGDLTAFHWSSDTVATLDFKDHDSVDRAILYDVRHTIDGLQVRIEKVKSSIVRQSYEQMIAPNDLKYCVHVKQLPPSATGEQLADLFYTQVWDVLIRRGPHPEKDPGEAWILNISSTHDAEQRAAFVTNIDGFEIQCEVEREPLNEWTLCAGNRDGRCKHGTNCIYRHVACTNGNRCIDEECPFSHSNQRAIPSNTKSRPPGPIEQQYRIKLDGLPLDMTVLELLVELKNQPLTMANFIETPEMPAGAVLRHFYLVRQAAEKLARKRVFAWHNYPIRQNYIVKCQLEYDRAPIEPEISTSSSIDTRLKKAEYQELRNCFAPLSPSDRNIRGMPTQWIWTNRRLGKMTSKIYLVYPSDSNDDRLGAMKLYQNLDDAEFVRAKREVMALDLLKNDPAIAPIYESHLPAEAVQRRALCWLITEIVSQRTLEDFIYQSQSEITFSAALDLTRQLLEIIRRCHKAEVFHRNLQPSHILVRSNNDSLAANEIKLFLIDFSLAWINNEKPPISDEEDWNILKEFMARKSIKNLSNTLESTYRCSSAIDATGVCDIFFWLLTDQWIAHTYSIDSSYREKHYQTNICNKIGTSPIGKHIYQSVGHIFDRAFGSFDDRWSIEKLSKELESIAINLATDSVVEFHTAFPESNNTATMPLVDPYVRVMTILARAKQQFAQNYADCVKWSTENNKWSNRSKEQEVRNIDEMIYDYDGQSCKIPIVSSAKIELDQIIISLSNGTSQESSNFRPICRLNSETVDGEVNLYFDVALKKLIQDALERSSTDSIQSL